MKTLSALFACLLALVVTSPLCCCAEEKQAPAQQKEEQSSCCCCAKKEELPLKKQSEAPASHPCACAVKEPRHTPAPDVAVPLPAATAELDLPEPNFIVLLAAALPPAPVSDLDPQSGFPPWSPPAPVRRALLVSRVV